MKIRPLLTAIIIFTTVPAFADDDTKKSDRVETRLQAIEDQLTRIEALLRASPSASSPSEVAPGQFRVTVLGQVVLPGVYAVGPETPVATLIGLAHGYARLADQSRILILSKDGKTYKVDAKKDPQAYKLTDGDIVTVSERLF